LYLQNAIDYIEIDTSFYNMRQTAQKYLENQHFIAKVEKPFRSVACGCLIFTSCLHLT